MNAALIATMSPMKPRKHNKVERSTPGDAEQYASKEHGSETGAEQDRALVELAKKLDKLVLGWAHKARPKEQRS